MTSGGAALKGFNRLSTSGEPAERGGMRSRVIGVVTLSLASFGAGTVMTPGSPGSQPFTPSRLEWAALELQAANGQNLTSESPLMITFFPWKDGRTVVCLLQYTDDYPAGAQGYKGRLRASRRHLRQ